MTTPQRIDSSFIWIHKILMPIMMFLLTAFFGIFSFVAKAWWTKIDQTLTVTNQRIARLEVDAARWEANRFTSQNWNEAKARIDDDRANLDRRVTRLEEAIPPIKETLLRIENKIDKISP